MTYQEFVALLASGRPGVPFAVRLTETDLLDLAHTYLGPETRSLVETPSVHIEHDRLKVAGGMTFLGVPFRLQVVGRPRVAEGHLQFELLELQVNGQPAPTMIRDQIERQMRERLTPDRLPFRVEAVELTPGALQLRGTTSS